MLIIQYTHVSQSKQFIIWHSQINRNTSRGANSVRKANWESPNLSPLFLPTDSPLFTLQIYWSTGLLTWGKSIVHRAAIFKFQIYLLLCPGEEIYQPLWVIMVHFLQQRRKGTEQKTEPGQRRDWGKWENSDLQDEIVAWLSQPTCYHLTRL